MPPWLVLALGAITATALALTFRIEGVERRVLRESAQPDALSIAYMTAWLSAHPGEHGLRLILARDLARLGRLDEARRELQPLEVQVDTLAPEVAERAALQGLDLDLTVLYAMTPDDRRRPEALRTVHARLQHMTLRSWSHSTEALLAERAAAVGASRQAVHWYSRALAQNRPQPPAWWAQGGRNMAALGEARLAAHLYLRARTRSGTLEAERDYFIAALQALRARSLLDEALTIAEAELGRLAGDAQTLEYLTRLALAAGRPDLAQRYAIRMLKLSLLPDALRAWQSRTLAAPPRAWQATAALLARLPPSVVRTQVASIDQRRPQLQFDAERYRLAYDVFLANGNLRDALVVARSAVLHAPNDITWRRRLAQVADFSGEAALALEQWHAIARQTDDSAAWAEVERRAPGVFDYARWLEALQRKLRRDPENLELLLRAAELHETLGEPERAIELLQRHARGRNRAGALRELAALAERVGDRDLQRSALQTLNREFGPTTADASALATVELARNDRAAALAALRSAESVARPDETAYWETYAHVALIAGERAAALRALQRLIDAGRASDEVLLDAAALREDEAPLQAAAWVRHVYERAPSVSLATRLLALYDRAADRAEAYAFVTGLEPQRLTSFERDADFLQQRAILWLAREEPARAAADALRALRLKPGDASLRALALWSLVAARDARALRALLAATAPLANETPELWGPVGAAWLALNEPAQALPWLQRQVNAHPGDYLWTLNLADATELVGAVDRAWQLRLRAWRGLRSEPPAAHERMREREVKARLATLAPLFEPGDAARRRLRELMMNESGADRPDPLAREAALAVYLSTEQDTIAQAWLLTQYMRALARPVWAELSVALATDDRARIGTLLDTVPDWLPLYDRVEAAQRMGRPALAQTLAFDGLAAQPDNEALHARLTANTLPRSPFLGFGGDDFSQRPLRESTYLVDGAEALSPRLLLRVEQRVTTRGSLDPAALVAALPTERTTALALDALSGHNGRVLARFERSAGLTTRNGLQFDAEIDLAADARLTASLAHRVAATDTAYLRIGGARDGLALGVQARLSTREFLAAEAQVLRYLVDSERIGDGTVLRLDLGHHLRLAYPDLSMRATLTDTRTRAAAGRNDLLASLLPPALQPSATNATFLPGDSTRLALTLSAGETARALPQRAWRPFATLSLVTSRAHGTGAPAGAASGGSYEWAMGLAGSVLGTDQLSLTLDHGSSSGASANPFTRFSLRYRWLH